MGDYAAGLDQWLTTTPSGRLGVVAHPASLTAAGTHTVDALIEAGHDVRRAFGPQHGMRGDKQDNMIESDDFADLVHGIPVHSLYGETRRLHADMLEDVDTLVFDLQDIGCRVYTFITTLRYVLEAASEHHKRVVVLDRPNPAGRPVDGLALEAGHESFVGSAPIPMRHGLTPGELAHYFVALLGLDVELEVIAMAGYDPNVGPGFGWPSGARPWVNPSPNAASLNMARCFSGTVMIEGTELSEGRGTTIPLEVIGAPNLPIADILTEMRSLAPEWLEGVRTRPCHFQPTFHKHAGSLCAGIQLHTDGPGYDHARFRPWRYVLLFLKALRRLHSDYALWHDRLYEYEPGRRAIDVIHGSLQPAHWVDARDATPADLETNLLETEALWRDVRAAHLIYPDDT